MVGVLGGSAAAAAGASWNSLGQYIAKPEGALLFSMQAGEPCVGSTVAAGDVSPACETPAAGAVGR